LGRYELGRNTEEEKKGNRIPLKFLSHDKPFLIGGEGEKITSPSNPEKPFPTNEKELAKKKKKRKQNHPRCAKSLIQSEKKEWKGTRVGRGRGGRCPHHEKGRGNSPRGKKTQSEERGKAGVSRIVKPM